METTVSEAACRRDRATVAISPRRAEHSAPLWIVEIPVTAGTGNGRQICAVRALSGQEALDEAVRRTGEPRSVARRRGAALDAGRATVTPWDWR